nr:hypothetical protein SYMBAF_20323 [Serratia symbiotica]
MTETALAAEFDAHLAQYLEANRKNGSTPKTVITPTGAFELATYRDRNGSFEPQRVKKHQTTLSDEIERKIIRMFALSISDKTISQEISGGSSVQPQCGFSTWLQAERCRRRAMASAKSSTKRCS